MSLVEVLVATIDQKDHALLDKMNIRTQAIIANQCDNNSIENLKWNKHRVIYLNFAERGVGLNRNNALMRAKGDYCIIADDDMIFYDDYENTVIEYFNKLKKADVLIFNIDEDGETGRRKNRKITKIRFWNYLNYGAARIVIRRKSVLYKGISFNLGFGGGAEHDNGEDTLFLRECLRKGLNIYAVPSSIAKLVETRESTWFRGYDEKHFYDSGIVLQLAHPVLCHMFVLFLVLSHKEYRIQSKRGIWPVITAYEEGIYFSRKRKWRGM